MRTRRREVLLRAGLGLLAVAALVQLVPYGRDHRNPPVTQDAPWPGGRARELATAACYETHGPTACHSGRWPSDADRLFVIQAEGRDALGEVARRTDEFGGGRADRCRWLRMHSAVVDVPVLSYRPNSLDIWRPTWAAAIGSTQPWDRRSG
jgi:hypothetical protein